MDFPRYIAHRGFYDNKCCIPENSLAAFSCAVEWGFAAELDVRFTADRKMVVFHDENTGRMCEEDLVISQTDYADLRKLKLLDTDEHIPLLSEVLKLVHGRVTLFIELKAGREVPDAAKRLAHMMKKYSGEYAVQSFDPIVLMKLRRADPEIVRGQLVSGFSKDKKILSDIAALKPVWRSISKPQYIAWDLRTVTLDSAFHAADIGAHFMTWTADSEELTDAAETFSGSVIFENVPKEYFDGKEI